MRVALALIVVVLLPACQKREETGRAGEAQDTVVTTKQTQDTMLVSHDTTVKVDMNVKHGDRPTRVDTVKKTSGATQPMGADTGTAR